MIGRIVTFSVERRWLVLLVTLIAAAIGAAALARLPIDAVPDITNNQVQVNIRAPDMNMMGTLISRKFRPQSFERAIAHILD